MWSANLGGLSKHGMHVWCKALWTVDHLANLSMLHGWDAMEYLVHEVLELVPVFRKELKLKVRWDAVLEAWFPPWFEPPSQDPSTPLPHVDGPAVVTHNGHHGVYTCRRYNRLQSAMS